MPFREAHEIVGKLVAYSVANHISLDQIPLAKMKELSPLFDTDVVTVFDVRLSLSQRPRSALRHRKTSRHRSSGGANCFANKSPGGSSSPLLDANGGGEAALFYHRPRGVADPPKHSLFLSGFIIFRREAEQPRAERQRLGDHFE